MSNKETIEYINTADLIPFKDHPFKSRDGEEKEQLLESIKLQGTIEPIIVRPSAAGKYEVISGHRRLEVCKESGIEKMPVIVRDLTDEQAISMMVDSNLHRKNILPSEKAFAYKMKMEAMNHQGAASRQVGEKPLSVTQISKDSDESERQIHRYIRLTHLIPELLSMADEGKIAFSPAVEISFLTTDEQRVLLDAMNLNDCTPSHAQAIRLKKYSKQGVLVDDTIYDILSEDKPNQQEQIKFRRDDICRYFPKSCTDKQIHDIVIKLLEQWQRKREKSRDAR